jgi:hypothetical protein
MLPDKPGATLLGCAGCVVDGSEVLRYVHMHHVHLGIQ